MCKNILEIEMKEYIEIYISKTKINEHILNKITS